MSKTHSTAELILDSAKTLIAVGGYHGFSYADVAEVVGIRKASIHHYFPAKSDLVVAVVKRYVEELRRALQSVTEAFPEPVNQLKAYTDYWRICIGDTSNPYCVCVMLAGELPSLPKDVAVAVREHFTVLRDWLESVLAAGAKAKTMTLHATAKVEADVMMAAVHGAMLSARAYGTAEVFGVVSGQLQARLAI